MVHRKVAQLFIGEAFTVYFRKATHLPTNNSLSAAY